MNRFFLFFLISFSNFFIVELDEMDAGDTGRIRHHDFNFAVGGKPLQDWLIAVVERFVAGESRLSASESSSGAADHWKIPSDKLSNFVEIGHGAFGVVYKAEYHHSAVAVKVSILFLKDNNVFQLFFLKKFFFF